MRPVFSALKLLGFGPRTERSSEQKPELKVISLKSSRGPIKCLVIETAGLNGSKVVMLGHGLVPMGAEDPRVLGIAHRMASTGVRVLIPHIPNVAALRIVSQDADLIAELIQVVADDSELCPNGRLGMMSASLSAGLCLAASGKPNVAHRISASLMVGTCTEGKSLFQFLMGGTEGAVDPYGRLIGLRSLAPRVYGTQNDLDRLLYLAALDLLPSEAVPDTGDLRKMPTDPDQKELFERLSSDTDFRVKEILGSSDSFQDLVEELDVASHLGSYRAPTTLLHGDNDKVVSPDQSRILYKHLKRKGVDCRLVISPLITHGQAHFPLFGLMGLPALVNSVAYFFRNLE
ncbi:MAG: hypothetical protein KDK23_16605 [Leptospiraceae bacterium]|nr:hypothetical protein [Leptospiraceae bacterium]